MNASSNVCRLIGIDSTDDWDSVWSEGIWFRVQPAGLGLEHRSECSDGSYSDGVHVHQTMAQAVTQEGRWQMNGFELIVIRGPILLADTCDVEGWILPPDSGEIIGRFNFDDLCDEFDAM